MNPYFTKKHFILISIMFSFFIVVCLAGFIFTNERFLISFIFIFTISYDIIAITQIAQLNLKNETLRKWFVIILLLGLISSPFVYRKFFV